MRVVHIVRAHLEQMQAQVEALAPEEACGLLAGELNNALSQQVFPITNELHSTTYYSMAPGEQLRAFAEIERRGWQLLAIYHSHPSGPQVPSQTDVAEANYPGVVHLIWARGTQGWSCRAFVLDEGVVQEVPMVTVD